MHFRLQEVDVMLGPMAPTVGRAEAADFTVPYDVNYVSLMTWKPVKFVDPFNIVVYFDCELCQRFTAHISHFCFLVIRINLSQQSRITGLGRHLYLVVPADVRDGPDKKSCTPIVAKPGTRIVCGIYLYLF